MWKQLSVEPYIILMYNCYLTSEGFLTAKWLKHPWRLGMGLIKIYGQVSQKNQIYQQILIYDLDVDVAWA